LSTLHVHIDESGDFSFTPTGSRYYIFTAAWTYQPLALGSALMALRFSFNKEGADLNRFHASTDQQAHRNSVVSTMLVHHSWWFASILIEKRKVNPVIRAPETFYPKFLNSILLFVFRGGMKPKTSKVLIYTDRIPADAKKKVVNNSIVDLCARCTTIPCHVMHHPSESNPWLQVADYCSWTICRKWENGDLRTYDKLKAKMLAPERDALRGGTRIYY
jgi:predicted N-acyltransferase